jgi:3-deoxy-D-manno-octulosonic-acid transferase
MYFLYSLLLGLAFVILLPRFLLDAFRHGKYVAGFRERLGRLAPLHNNGRPVVWIHCVSVGETQAARPLIKGLRERFPNHGIAISTTTRTGQELARDIFKNDAERIFYFPFDWRWTIRRALKAVNPAAVLIMETELWPGFLRECSVQKIPVAIVNGRLSGRAFRRYRMIKGFMSRVLRSISLAIMQTEADGERMRALGMNPDRVVVAGNLKFDAGAIRATDSITGEFRERFGLGSDTLLILAASTHAPEEKVILDALKQIGSIAGTKPRLMLVPRHPERFAEVAALIEASGFSWARRTAAPDPRDTQSDIVLLDSIGELQSVYPLASIVFVGGSIARSGGHNILEPAAVGACVITGAHTHNFQVIIEKFVRAGAVVQLPQVFGSEASLKIAAVISDLLVDAVRRQQIGHRAEVLVKQNVGATERTLELLETIIPTSAPALDQVDYLRVQDAPSA